MRIAATGRSGLVCGLPTALVGCLLATLASCSEGAPDLMDSQRNLVQVTAVKVKREPFQETIPLLAKVEARARQELFPLQEGTISYPKRFHGGLTDGAEVAPGETLAFVHNRELDADLAETEIQLEAAEKEQERMAQQVKSGLVSRQRADEILLKLRLAKQRRKRLLEQRRVRGVVTTPAGGRLEVTKAILPATNVSSTTALAELLVGGDPLVKGVAAASQAEKIRVGLSVLVRRSTNAAALGTGRVFAVSPSVSAAGTVEVTARIDGRQSLPLPGEGVLMLVQLPPVEGIPLPEEAVVYRGETPGVFLLRRSLRGRDRYFANLKVVRTGPRSEGRILVYEGLKEGDLVAVKGASLLGGRTMVTLADDRPAKEK